MAPPEELALLRCNPRRVENLMVRSGAEIPLEDVHGRDIELRIEMDSGTAARFGVAVCCSPDSQERTAILYDALDHQLKIDTTASSLGEGPKSVEGGPFKLGPGEPLVLRVFVDQSVVEVFANDRQAVMRRIYPTRPDSQGVVLFSQGGDTRVRCVEAWDMAPANAW